MGLWRKIRRGLVALFVCAHLAVLLTYNVLQLMPGDRPEPLYKATNRAMQAAAIGQRWDMFSPNVGSSAGAPVLVLGFADGSFEYVPSDSMPGLQAPVPDLLQIHKLPVQARACAWKFHLADGRWRKFETHVCKPGPAYMPLRTTWTRWMLQQWLSRNPQRGEALRIVQFARAEVVFDEPGPVPRIDRVTMYQIEPRMDPHWPLPRVRQIPGVLP